MRERQRRLQGTPAGRDLNNKSSAPQSEEVNYSGAGKFIMLVTSHARPVNTGMKAQMVLDGDAIK